MTITFAYPLQITNTVFCDRFPMGSEWKRVEGYGG
jgi:hypothetical protein